MAPERTKELNNINIAINNEKLAKPGIPERCINNPAMMKTINHLFLNTALLGFECSLPSGRMKLTAKTGLKKNATINDAASVSIKMVGK